LEIGNNVEFRRSIEIRVHGQSNIKIGDNCRIDRGVRLLSNNDAEISLGTGTKVGLYSIFNGGDSIFIGRKCLISGFVYLQTSMHGFVEKTKSIQEQGYKHAPIFLKDDCWLASHVVIMPGVILKKGAIVGSNAVVNKDVEEFDVVAGIPAKPIKKRN
jgi:acetyltransferase-like isoleucine patch superfamily enzyme